MKTNYPMPKVPTIPKKDPLKHSNRCKSVNAKMSRGYYTGMEPSPKGHGLCSRDQPVGTKMMGRNGEQWIVRLRKNKSHFWCRYQPTKQRKAKLHRVPRPVRQQAELALKMKSKGYEGGTQAGTNRARQLAEQTHVDDRTVMQMRAWFARHGPTASNGGTSYPGYRKWIQDKKPSSGENKNKYRGAVAYLLWGGQPGWEWVNKVSPIARK